MKIINILLILLIISSLLFLPLAKQSVEYQLLPFNETVIAVNIQSPEVILSTDFVFEVEVTISRYNPQQDTLVSVYNITLNGEFVKTGDSLDLDQRGYYIFTFLAEVLIKVTIAEAALPLSTYIIVIGLAFLVVLNYIYRRFVAVPEI